MVSVKERLRLELVCGYALNIINLVVLLVMRHIFIVIYTIVNSEAFSPNQILNLA